MTIARRSACAFVPVKVASLGTITTPLMEWWNARFRADREPIGGGTTTIAWKQCAQAVDQYVAHAGRTPCRNQPPIPTPLTNARIDCRLK